MSDPQLVKGTPVRVFQNQQIAALSDYAVDCRGYNAVTVEVLVNGSAAPTGTLTVKGCSAESGIYQTLPDPNALQTAMTVSDVFDVVVGSAWVKIDLSSVSGTYGVSQGWTVTVTPYLSPGLTTVNVTNTVAENLTQYGSVAVGAGNAIHVQPGTAATWDVSDRAARDLGKVDIASLDQYTPIDVDTDPATLNALPVTWRKASSGGAEFGTSTNPVRTDPTNATKTAGTVADGDNVALGATADLDTASTVIGRLKKLVSLLAGGLPAALSAGGGVKVGVVDALPTGSAVIGKVSVDQTTPGTTDSVSVATAQGAGATIGVTTGAAVTSDVAGTVQQYLRGLVKMVADAWIDAANALRVQLANSAGTEIGTAGAPVRTDPTGTTAQPVSGTGIMTAATVTVEEGKAVAVDAAVAAVANLRLVGFACRESAATAAAATFEIRHGATAAGGTTLVPVELGPDQSRADWYGPDGLPCASGLSLQVIAGTVDVILYTKVVA